MTETIEEQLCAEISSILDDLSEISIGTEEYKNAVENVSKLIEKLNEINKIKLENEKHDLNKRIEENKNTKEKELDEFNKKDQLVKNVISVGSIVIPVLVTIWGTYKTLKFEETGTVTTIMGRGFVNKLIPKK